MELQENQVIEERSFKGRNPLEVLKEVYGYPSFRENQEEAIDLLIKGKNDVLFLAKTGLGKSIVFIIPALIKEGTAIIVSPLLSLMDDQVIALQNKGLRAETINSSIGVKKKREVFKKIEEGSLDLLYVAPETLLNPELLDYLKSKLTISFIGFDEAHCISQYGSDFRPKYKQVTVLREHFNCPMIALTATADVKTVEDMINVLKFSDKSKYPFVKFTQDFDRASISYTVIQKNKTPLVQLQQILNTRSKDETGIIYAATRKEVDSISYELYKKGYSAEAYHAGLPNKKRKQVLDNWLNNKTKIAVCTTAFGMGIDKADVRYVIHYTIPSSIEGYAQECVYPSSLISTKRGLVPAYKVLPSDELLTFNEKNNYLEYQPLNNIIKGTTSEWLEFVLDNEQTLKVTPNHPLYVNNKEWVRSDEVKVKDCLTNLGIQSSVISINRLKVENKKNILLSDNSILYTDENFNLLDRIKHNSNRVVYEPQPSSVKPLLFFLNDKCYIKLKDTFIDTLRSKTTPSQLSNLLGYKRSYDWPCAKKDAISFNSFIKVIDCFNYSLEDIYPFIEHVGSSLQSSSFKNIPFYLNEDLAYLIGFIATDGNIKIVKSEQRGVSFSIRLFNKNEKILNKLRIILSKYFSSFNERIERDIVVLSFSNPLFLSILSYYGINPGNKTYTVDCLNIIPHSESILKSFVAGVFDGDGNSSKKCNLIRIVSASLNFTRNLHFILNKLGFNPTLDVTPKEKQPKATSDLYWITIGSYSLVKIFKENIGPFSQKEINLISVSYSRKPKERSIKIIAKDLPDLLNTTINFSVFNNNNYFANGILVKNCGRASRDGLPSDTYLLYSKQDISKWQFILRQATTSSVALTHKLEKLGHMNYIAVSDKCIRKSLLSYFGQKYGSNNCGSCSNCVKSVSI